MRIIAFEGVNAAGKSAVAAHMRKSLQSVGRTCLCVDPAEFGQLGKTIRREIVHPDIKTPPNVDAMLFAALRVEGCARILEAIQSDPSTIILLERWSLALAAYGAADGARPQLIAELREVLRGSLPVDMTILFDVSGEIAHKRIGQNGSGNRFESKGAGYLDVVGDWYRHFAILDDNTTIIDASGDLQNTYKLLCKALIARWADLSDIQ